MNPTEIMWEIVERKIKAENITTKTELIEILIRVWNQDDEVQTNCKTFIESMPQRIATLIKVKGGFRSFKYMTSTSNISIFVSIVSFVQQL